MNETPATVAAPSSQTSRRPKLASRLLRHKSGAASLAVILIFGAIAALGSLIQPFDPVAGNVVASFSPPSAEHWLGTDDLGRDVLSRVMDGAKIALIVAIVSVGVAAIIGLVIGVIAGYAGGFLDLLITRAQDVLFAFPTLLLAVIVSAVLGPGLINASLAIALVYIPRFGRIARSATLQVKHSEFLDAARLAGVPVVRMLLRHVVPNVMPSVLVLAALSVSTAQLAYASLAFLGLGVSPPQADWGSMLSEGRNFVTVAPWMVIAPAAALVILMVAFNVVGDAVRDVMDPRGEHSKGAPIAA